MFWIAIIAFVILVCHTENETTGSEEPSVRELFEKSIRLYHHEHNEENQVKAAAQIVKAAVMGLRDARKAMIRYDLFHAVDWKQLADEIDDLNWLCEIADHYSNDAALAVDLELAFYCYNKAAQRGSGQAMYELGDCYWFGEGCLRDEYMAVKWYIQASKLGNEDADLALEVLGFSTYESTDDLVGCFVGNYVMDMHIKKIWKRARDGDAHEMVKLGGIYSNSDWEEAERWFTSAMEKGHSGAYFAMIDRDLTANPVAKPSDDSRNWYESAIQNVKTRITQGEVTAWYDLGICYQSLSRSGTKLIRNIERKTLDCFLKAAEAGHAGAQYEVGIILRDGDESCQNAESAAQWLLKSANQGHRSAMYELGTNYKPTPLLIDDPLERDRWLKTAAQKGHPTAQRECFNNLVQCSAQSETILDVISDLPEAQRWFFILAYQGDFGDFGFDTFHDEFFPNDTQALRWLRRMEVCKYPQVSRRRYDYIERNRLAWDTVDADNGNPAALFELGLGDLYGWSGAIVYEKSLLSLRESARAGNPEALSELGHLHFVGIGVTRDIDAAISFWQQAAGLRSTEAALALKAIEAYGKEIARRGRSGKEVDPGVCECDESNLRTFMFEAEHGNQQALYGLADYFLGLNDDDRRDEYWLKKAALKFHPGACCYFMFYEFDDSGLEHNPVGDALAYYTDPAHAGDAEVAYGVYQIYSGSIKKDASMIALKVLGVNETDWSSETEHKLLLRAAGLGNPRAQYLLGRYYLDIVFNVGGADDEFPPAVLEKWKESNDDAPDHRYREYLALGSVRQVVHQAIKWLRLAAMQGNLDARLALGLIFNCQDLMPVNREMAANWLSVFPTTNTLQESRILGSAFSGDFFRPEYSSHDPWIQTSIRAFAEERGIILDHPKARQHLLTAANNQCPESMYRLAVLLLNEDWEGRDPDEAFRWMYGAAQRYHPRAMHILGTLFYNGIGTSIDKTRAFEWCRKAAKAGFDPAMYALGRMYMDGEGTDCDPGEAFKWLSASKLKDSAYFLGFCYFHGWGVARDRKEALKLWSGYYLHGYDDITYHKGLIYLEGIDVEKDLPKAIECFKSATKTSEAAHQKLAELGLSDVTDTSLTEKEPVYDPGDMLDDTEKLGDLICLTDDEEDVIPF